MTDIAATPASPTSSSYVRHLNGIMHLLTWLTRWQGYTDSFRVDASIVRLASLPSRRFALAVPTSPRLGRSPVLLFQNDEQAWAQDITWHRAVVVPDQRLLYLVAQRCVGDRSRTPDLPSFAVALEFDDAEKTEILASAASHSLEARGLWFEDGQPKVGNGVPIWTLPMQVQTSNESVLSESEQAPIQSFRDLVNEQFQKTARTSNPGYQGDLPTLTEEQRKWV